MIHTFFSFFLFLSLSLSCFFLSVFLLFLSSFHLIVIVISVCVSPPPSFQLFTWFYNLLDVRLIQLSCPFKLFLSFLCLIHSPNAGQFITRSIFPQTVFALLFEFAYNHSPLSFFISAVRIIVSGIPSSHNPFTCTLEQYCNYSYIRCTQNGNYYDDDNS